MSAFMLLILIPLWYNLIVPVLLVYNIEVAPLKSVTFGGISAGLSFLCAGCLQLRIEDNQLLQSTNSGAAQLSILWQLPQFFFIMMGEVLLSIPGLQFAFEQAPPAMKSVLTAAWFCNNAFGNLIIVAVTEWQPFKLQSNEYFFYATLMFVAMLVYCGGVLANKHFVIRASFIVLINILELSSPSFSESTISTQSVRQAMVLNRRQNTRSRAIENG